MIDILNNVGKNFMLIKDFKTWIYPMTHLPSGTFLNVEEIKVNSGNGYCAIGFKISKDSVDSLIELLKEKTIEAETKSNKKNKKLFEKMIKTWEEQPDLFKLKQLSFSKKEKIYNCSKDLFGDDYTCVFSTGCGSNTFYEKEYYVERLKTWDKDFEDALKRLKKNVGDYKKSLKGAEIEIMPRELDSYLMLAEAPSTTTTKKKKSEKFVVDGDLLNDLMYFLDNDGGEVNDELIEYAKEEEESNELIDFLNKIKGACISSEHEGYHHNDGQICEYTLCISMPDGTDYYAYDEHSLMNGWSFHGKIELSQN